VSLSIRPAVPDDVGALQALGFSDSVTEGITLYVADAADGVIGFLAAEPREVDGEEVLRLTGLSVLPDRRGRGIGAALHIVFLNKFLASDASSAVAELPAGETRAQTFLQRRGWKRESGAAPDHDATVVMRLRRSVGVALQAASARP
jgi:N-acetylglutamate synthase-like GNAT family acetyltransferase